MSDKQRLVCVIMGQNCERFIKMCLESVKDADAIVYCDGGSTDEFKQYFEEQRQILGLNIEWIENKYDQEDKTMNGKQRNFYLKYLQENYPYDYCLCIDADEVVDDLSKIKEFIQKALPGLYSVKMRHFQQDLGHEDATVPTHYVLHRLFKISEADKYPEVEHPILIPIYRKENNMPPQEFKGYTLNVYRHPTENDKFAYIGQTDCTTIWHLAYIPNLWEIKKRYENHMKKSDMHTPEFLKSWYYSHLFGEYPKKELNPIDIPRVILKEFGIEKDAFYFQNRNIQVKNSIMVKQWADYFKPKDVLDLGAGRGCYLYFWKWYTAFSYGIELSQWAVNNAFCNDIKQGDISDEKNYDNYDLITAIDVLEHLTNEQLDKTLTNMVKHGKRFLFSIPFDADPELNIPADPNLLNDNTHKQFRSKREWVKLIQSYGIKIEDAPPHWSYAPQILIGEKV